MSAKNEKRWKRGDIGPDGRVFWAYHKNCKNGEWWTTPEKYESEREKISERMRKYRESNLEKISERMREYHKANREKLLEQKRKYREANRERDVKQSRKYYESNREKLLEQKRKLYRQQSADQFFIMQAAANEIQEALKSIQP